MPDARHVRLSVPLERFKNLPKYASIPTVAKRLGISKGQIYRWKSDKYKTLKVISTCGRTLVNCVEIAKWMRDRKKIKNWWKITDQMIDALWS